MKQNDRILKGLVLFVAGGLLLVGGLVSCVSPYEGTGGGGAAPVSFGGGFGGGGGAPC